MRAPSLKKQVFGDDLEQQLNIARQKINNEIREKCLKNNKDPNGKFDKVRENWNIEIRKKSNSVR